MKSSSLLLSSGQYSQRSQVHSSQSHRLSSTILMSSPQSASNNQALHLSSSSQQSSQPQQHHHLKPALRTECSPQHSALSQSSNNNSNNSSNIQNLNSSSKLSFLCSKRNSTETSSHKKPTPQQQQHHSHHSRNSKENTNSNSTFQLTNSLSSRSSTNHNNHNSTSQSSSSSNSTIGNSRIAVSNRHTDYSRVLQPSSPTSLFFNQTTQQQQQSQSGNTANTQNINKERQSQKVTSTSPQQRIQQSTSNQQHQTTASSTGNSQYSSELKALVTPLMINSSPRSVVTSAAAATTTSSGSAAYSSFGQKTKWGSHKSEPAVSFDLNQLLSQNNPTKHSSKTATLSKPHASILKHIIYNSTGSSTQSTINSHQSLLHSNNGSFSSRLSSDIQLNNVGGTIAAPMHQNRITTTPTNNNSNKITFNLIQTPSSQESTQQPSLASATNLQPTISEQEQLQETPTLKGGNENEDNENNEESNQSNKKNISSFNASCLEDILQSLGLDSSSLNSRQLAVKECLSGLLSRIDRVISESSHSLECVVGQQATITNHFDSECNAINAVFEKCFTSLQRAKDHAHAKLQGHAKTAQLNLETVLNMLKRQTEDTKKIKLDIEENLENIFTNLELKPFQVIVSKYSHKLDLFEQAIAASLDTTVQILKINTNNNNNNNQKHENYENKSARKNEANEVDQQSQKSTNTIVEQLNNLLINSLEFIEVDQKVNCQQKTESTQPQLNNQFQQRNNPGIFSLQSNSEFIIHNPSFGGSDVRADSQKCSFSSVENAPYQASMNSNDKELLSDSKRSGQTNVILSSGGSYEKVQELRTEKQVQSHIDQRPIPSRGSQVYVSFNNENIFSNHLANIHGRTLINSEDSSKSNELFIVKKADNPREEELIQQTKRQSAQSLERTHIYIESSPQKVPIVLAQTTVQSEATVTAHPSLNQLHYSVLDPRRSVANATVNLKSSSSRSNSSSNHNSNQNQPNAASKSPNSSAKYLELIDKINTSQVNTNNFYSTLLKEGAGNSSISSSSLSSGGVGVGSTHQQLMHEQVYQSNEINSKQSSFANGSMIIGSIHGSGSNNNSITSISQRHASQNQQSIKMSASLLSSSEGEVHLRSHGTATSPDSMNSRNNNNPAFTVISLGTSHSNSAATSKQHPMFNSSAVRSLQLQDNVSSSNLVQPRMNSNHQKKLF